MEDADSRSHRTHRTTVAAFALIAFALIGALVLMHNSDAAERAERQRLELRLDELSREMTSLQAEMATAPRPVLLDASVGDFPTAPKPTSPLKTDGPDMPTPKQERNSGF